PQTKVVEVHISRKRNKITESGLTRTNKKYTSLSLCHPRVDFMIATNVDIKSVLVIKWRCCLQYYKASA
ncbi:hypothetical protein, partial [Francisella tularensis]|uniref:hypothetical protein n=1 Tax=Francisella tularensis TaxID=263 RepID=UPI003C6D19ED